MQKVITKQDLGFTYNADIIIKKHKQSYEKWKWIVLIGCFLLQMFPYCVSVNLAKNLYPEIIYWLDNNNFLFTFGYTLATIFSSIAGPFIAKLFNKKISLRLIYGIGASAACLGFMMYGINAIIPNTFRTVPIATTIWWVCNIIIQIGLVIFSGLGINNLITRWWPDNKRGFAFGVAFAGGSAGNIWMQYLMANLITKFQNGPNKEGIYQPAGEPHLQYLTYVILGSIGLVAALIIIMVICRKPIAPVCMFEQEIKAANASQQSVTLLNTKSYPAYWILCIGFMLIQMSSLLNQELF